MSDTTDIIGIVKELQAYLNKPEQSNLLCAITCCKEKDGSVNLGNSDREFFAKIVENFPSIAQAFLVSVEALEKIDSDGHYKYDLGDKTASQALSQIRSLPSHDN